MLAEPAQRYKRPESALVVVYSDDGQVLLLRRADHPAFWQSVTGSMQWEEDDPRVAALRELHEETGLAGGARLRDLQQTHRYTILPHWRHRYAPGVTENLEHAFALRLPAAAPVTLNPQEHTEYQWLPFAEAQAYASSWSDRDTIRFLATHPV